MAVTGNALFNNAIVGTPQVGADVDIRNTHVSPKLAVGSVYERSDGCRFRYSHFGANVTAGTIVSQDLSESSWAFTENAVIDPGSGTNVAGETIAHNAIGSRYVEITDSATAHSANYYAGGYLVVVTGAGDGFTYRIKGSTLTGIPASGRIRLELYEPLVEALNATSDIQIFGSKYANLEGSTAATDTAVAGVACATVTVATAAFGWIQSRGPCGVFFGQGSTGVASDLGRLITIDGAAQAGAAEIAGADAAGLSGSSLANELVREPIIGRYLLPPVGIDATGAFIAVDLMLE